MQKNYLVMIFLFVIILTVSTTTALKSNHLTTSNRTEVVQKVKKIYTILLIYCSFFYMYVPFGSWLLPKDGLCSYYFVYIYLLMFTESCNSSICYM